jgi:hypothetical protein
MTGMTRDGQTFAWWSHDNDSPKMKAYLDSIELTDEK